jgi:predicted NAD/FAD-binding protein
MSSRPRIAVVGGGAGGLVAAYKLRDFADVDVYEAASRAGGHIHAPETRLAEGAVVHTDTGFIAWSPHTYPKAAALFEELGVPSRKAEYPVYVWDKRDASFSKLSDFPTRCGRDLSLEAGRDLRRLVALLIRAGASLEPVDDESTLAQFLEQRGYHRDLVEHLVLPAMVVVWGYQVREVLAMSTGAALGLMRRTMFLDTGAEYRQLWPSSEPYRRALLAALPRKVRTGCPVTRVDPSEGGVVITSAAGEERFDAAILAANPPRILGMLARPTEAQRRLLTPLETHLTWAVVHEDRRFFPIGDANERAFITTWLPSLPDGRRRCCTTWNMGAFHGLTRTSPLLVTIGDEHIASEIDPARTHEVITNEHIALTPAYRAARLARAELEIKGRLYMSGSWLGPVGSHECAVSAAIGAAERVRADL